MTINTDRLVWMKARYVQPGDQYLAEDSLVRVTRSERSEQGTWMIRSDWGVAHFHPEAPVALMVTAAPAFDRAVV